MIEFDDEAASEISRTFEEGEASVWGLTVIAIEERIAEVTRLPTVGQHYPNEHDARSARAQFSQPNDPPLEITKQGCKRMSIPPPYNELAMHIIKYFTCEWRFSNLHAHHFKLLSHIRHNLVINVPNFLFNMLCISVEETQKGKENSIPYHALIKLLIERSLRDVSPMTWEEFVRHKNLQL